MLRSSPPDRSYAILGSPRREQQFLAIDLYERRNLDGQPERGSLGFTLVGLKLDQVTCQLRIPSREIFFERGAM